MEKDNRLNELRSRLKQSLPPELAIAQALYLFYYLALGAFMPYINLYYERLGMSGVQIGALAALPVLVSSGSSLLLGALADARRWHRSLLRVGLLLSAVTVLILSQARTFAAIIPVIIAYAIVNSASIPLLDSSALEAAQAHGKTYGVLRLWGSVGWAASTVLIGWLIERMGIHWLFYGYVVLMSLTFLISLFQPPRKGFLRSSLKHGLRILLARKTFLLFLLSTFLLAVTSGGVLAFFSIYMDSIGASESLIGFGWALSAVSEVPVMLLSGKIIRRIGSKGIIALAIAIFAVRWLLFSWITNPYLALAVQLLHGLSFASFAVGCVTYINEHTPEGLNTTALAILNTVNYGLGSMAGSFLGGIMLDKAGMPAMFQVFTLVAALSLVVFAISQRTGRQKIAEF